MSNEPAWMGPAPLHYLQSAAVFLRQKEAGTYLSVTATKGETIMSPALTNVSIKKMERVKVSVRGAGDESLHPF